MSESGQAEPQKPSQPATSAPTSASTTVGEPSARSGRIVVGLDGSDASIEALRRGYVISRALHTNLEAVTAWHFPPTYGAYIESGWSPDQDAYESQVTAVRTVFGEDVPSWFSSRTVEGLPAEVLINESKGAEMLIVGSRGHGGFAGLLLGSVSSACAEHAQCPVLVLHADDAR